MVLHYMRSSMFFSLPGTFVAVSVSFLGFCFFLLVFFVLFFFFFLGGGGGGGAASLPRILSALDFVSILVNPFLGLACDFMCRFLTPWPKIPTSVRLSVR